ncbi:DUF4946 domain-containing protein [Burkholderia lata]|uniref:DUF4946 domain-containing protein n=1 Tax=Burkholderia lata (strain ATCC 17760 / DSM 23089 / LMG 22485 / NCIMB 9086 / R18194 / 383) TaxID=482957 RepID=A0A6P2SRX8_BURL3|nr:DUF4946 domain-containing protein [Burkholderia lata]VWC53258.1 hypothetical protein BLA18109_00440 [Burkholderia lata]
MNQTPRFRLTVRAISVWSFIGATTAFAGAPDTVAWPSGWEVSPGPAPATRAGKTLPGSNDVAVKRGASGTAEAVISLMRIVRTDHGAARLDHEFDTMQRTIVDGYRNRGWTAQCTAAGRMSLGGRPGLATTCDMHRADGTAIRQTLVATMSETTVYGLSYTAPVDRFDAGKPEFDTMRAHLAVQ